MLRCIAALTVALLLPLAVADSTDPSRDANLALINGSCLVVGIHSADSTISSASIAAAKEDVLSALANKALLYSLPARRSCTADQMRTLPMVFLYFDVAGTALLAELEVLLPEGASGYAYPDVWNVEELFSRPGGFTPNDIRDEAPKLFDVFALAWKKVRQP